MNMKDSAAPVSVSVAWKDAKGKTAKVQAGSLTITSDNPDAVEVTGDEAGGFKVGPGPNTSTPDGDPTTGVIATVTITAAADADLGDGVTPVSAVGSIVLLAAGAVTGEITFGA